MKKILLFFSAAVIASVSCTKESAESFSQKGSYLIGINEPVFKSTLTKSDSGDGELFDSIVIDTIGGQAISMDGYVSDICPDCPVAETKGYVTTTNNILKFWMSAYANSAWHDNTIPEGEKGSKTNPNAAGEYFKEKVTSRPSASSNEWSIADSPKWINDKEMSFWSWSGSIGSLTSSSTSVAGPTPTADLANNKATVTYRNNGQFDLIYAFNKERRKFDDKTGEITEGSGTYNSDYKDKMDIKFYHALSAVRFDVSGLKENGLIIKTVTIKGVVNEATCVITAPATQGDPLDFDWTPKAASNNVTNVTTGELTSSDFTEDGLNGTTEEALMSMSSSKFLFLIPQEVQGKGITIEIVYSVGTATETTTSEVSLDHDTKWEAGKYYTYKLSAGSVKLALNGSLTGDSPEISVKNTGQVNTYIRVAIVGNWCMEDNTSTPSEWYPLSECPASDIVFTSFNSTNDSHNGHWTLNTSDGYWYYSLPVQPGWEVDLFEGFAAKTDAVHPAGTTLRLTVIGQAVKAGDATDWAGAATVSY